MISLRHRGVGTYNIICLSCHTIHRDVDRYADRMYMVVIILCCNNCSNIVIAGYIIII